MAAFAAVNGATTAGLDPDVGRLCALCSGATCRSDRSGSFFPARRRSGSGNSAGGGGKRQTSTNASSLGRREGVILNSPFLRRGGLKNGDGTSPAALLSSILLTWQCRSRRGSLTKLAGNDKRMMMTESSPVRSASQNWREETKGSTSETWREETRGSTSQTVSKRGEEVKCGCGVEKIGGNDRESGQLRSGHVSRRTQEEDSPSRQSTTYEQRGKLTRERERAESGEATEDRRGEVATSNAATWRVLNGGDDTWRPRRTISFHRRLDRATPAALASISSSISSSSPVEELAGREENDEVMNVRRSFEEWCMRELEMAKREGNRKRERAISEKRAAMMRARIDSWFRKLRGRVKPGEVENPIPDNAITFAQFKELLRLQAVNHIQYGDQGRKLAVILPYANKEGSRSGKQPVEFHRHEVKPVPADGWSDIWQDLHRQVAHIEVIPPPSPFQPFTHLSKMYLAIVPGTWLAWRLLAWALPQPVQKEGPHMRQLELWERKERRWRRQSRTLELFDTEAKPQQDSTSAINVIGKARTKVVRPEEGTGVTFDDVAGIDYVKTELMQIVEMLKSDDNEYTQLGLYCPKGVLLWGPPGTGKTLMAKAIAGEAQVPFFASSGTEFVEMFMGVAAARVRDLFARAREAAPSIIFIDEIDAIGAKRGTGSNINVEREQGLMQILTEMDGFDIKTEKVLLLATTNRPDMLDPALLRRGRFDKVIRVGTPSEEGRYAILKVHSRNKMFESEEEKERLLRELASKTDGATGAELQNILNEAAILQVRYNSDYVSGRELNEAYEKQNPNYYAEKEVDTGEETLTKVAYREAAICVLECYFPETKQYLLKTDVNGRAQFPNTQFGYKTSRTFSTKESMIQALVRQPAQRMMEEMVFGRGDISVASGAGLSSLGHLAEFMILTSGMTALGRLGYYKDYDVMENVRPKLSALRNAYVSYAKRKCASILRECRPALEAIAERLMETLELTGDEIRQIFDESPRIPQEPVPPVNEQEVLLYTGRWGIHGVSLPGRVTFSPGNCGYATFGAPRPHQVRVVSDTVWDYLKARSESVVAKRAELAEEDKRAEELEIQHDNRKQSLLEFLAV